MKLKVKGSGAFPLDMLRYDNCYPASEVDAGLIASTFDGWSRWEVCVARPDKRGSVWTDRRWESFGCKVEEL